MRNRPLLPAFDGNGREVEKIAFVQLGRDPDPAKLAMIYRDDYDRLLALGVSGNWSLNGSRNVVAIVKAGLHTVPWQANVARLISKAKAGEAVRFRDGNSLNLIRENLAVSPGNGRSDDFERLMLRQHDLKVETVIHDSPLVAVPGTPAYARISTSYQRTNGSVCAACEDARAGCNGSCASGY